ncbi:hypothetical protein vseg_016082 [Gypsophila vaccaria]
MENLPQTLLTEILTRLTDSSDLTRCRLVSKPLNSASYDVNAFRFFCSYDRYTKSQAYPSKTRFKPAVTRLVTQLSQLESVSLGVDNSLSGLDSEDGEEDDLHLTETGFVSGWLDCVKDRLRRFSVVDFWVQASWRRSNLLSLISTHCHRLNVLEIKNAWLSVEGLTTMSSLTSLTLEYVRLDDENLSALNACFPCLETLNLIGVGVLLDPKICLQHLRSCQWTISNAPVSLTIVAPKLVNLKLECVRPRSLVLETPSLSDFHLVLETTGSFNTRNLPHLHKLQLKSNFLHDLIHSFPLSEAVKQLRIDSIKRFKHVEREKPNLELLFDVFPNINSLSLGPEAYSDIEASFSVGMLQERKGIKCLKDFTAHLVITDIEVTLSFISSIVDNCDNLSAISLLVHRELDPVHTRYLMSKCEALCSRAHWKWGFWKEDRKDVWISSIVWHVSDLLG